jgi:signal transduction histidine kinase/streptogramin lyase
MRWRTLLTATVLWLVPAVFAQTATPVGLPFLRSFRAGEEYMGHVQNWAIVQDQRGVMYFGNTNGVMEYDGHDFRMIPLSNGSIARSLALAADGTIYVGGVGDLGYLAPDSSGKLGFVSLRDQLPEEHRDFGDVWRVYITPDGVLFNEGFEPSTLMWWSEGRFRVHEMMLNPWLYLVNGEVYIIDRDHGLQKLVAHQPVSVPGGEPLAKLGTVMSIMAWDDSSLLIITPSSGLHLFQLDQGRLTRFATDADEELMRYRVYCSTALPDGRIALGSASGGVFILDRQGRLVHRLTKSQGLLDSSVWYLAADQEGGLWMALNVGLVRADISSAFTIFDEYTGLDGTVEAVTRHNGALYAGTSTGLKVMHEGSFRIVGENRTLCWTVISFIDPNRPDRSRLMTGRNQGIGEVMGGQERIIIDGPINAYSLLQSPGDPARLLAGYQSGLWTLRLENGDWRDEGRVAEVTTEVRSMVEDADGRLWIGSHFDGVFRLEMSPGTERRVSSIEQFGLEHGLPSLKSVKAVDLGEEVVFATAEGIYRFDEAESRFTPDNRFAVARDGEPVGMYRAVPDSAGNLWISLEVDSHAGIIRPKADGPAELIIQPFLRLREMGVYALLPEADGITWIGGTRGLFRYDSGKPVTYDSGYHTLLRRVATGDGEDLFGGAGEGAVTGTLSSPLDFTDNSVRFQYSATSYIGERGNQYSTMLEGYDEDWSPWTENNTAGYMNLHEGRYRFLVRSRNLYGTEGVPASYTFRILPPWYRTWWAYLGYVAFAVTLLYSVAWLRSARLEREKAQLEAIVRERTAELSAYTQRLLATQSELEFFSYSVSHDLRAPLRRISSFARVLLDQHGPELQGKVPHYLERIDSNAQHLADLVDDLLKLSRVTRARLKEQQLDLSAMARQVCDELAGTEPEREVEVQIEAGLTAEGDPMLVGLALQNLIGNAWKFTRHTAGARIEVGVIRQEPCQMPVFFVKDNGAGFDMQYASTLFAPFKRLHKESEFEGSGIGLASVKRSVVRHGGTVWAEAEVDQGATFYFTLAPAS